MKESKVNKTGKTNKINKGKFYKERKQENAQPAETKENDYTFYAADEQIARDVASIPFNYISGGNFDYETNFGIIGDPSTLPVGPINATASEKYNKSLLNFASIRYLPSIGVTNAKNEGVNMSSLQLYAYIRRSNSGARNYEAPDLMMYGLGFKDLIKEYSECRRILGLTNKSHYFNHSFPDLALASLNIDGQDLRANWAKYRAELNIIGKKINSFAFPNIFKAFNRAVFISSFLFTDSTSPRAQFYAFKSDGYYTWSGTTNERGTELVYHRHFVPSLSTKVQTFQNRLDILNEQIDALFLDEDALTMSGDIMKAFPESQLLQVLSVDENLTTESYFDENILGQIENMITVLDGEEISGSTNTNNPSVNKTFNITQEDQIIKFNPIFNTAKRLSEAASTVDAHLCNVFNSHKDLCDYKDVLEWSRLMTTYIPYAVGTTQVKNLSYQVTSSGLEIPIYMELYNYKYVNGSDTVELNYFPQFPFAKNWNSYTDAVAAMCRAMQLDWHPVIYSKGSGDNMALGFDTKVSTIIRADTLKSINNAAIYGAYYTGSLFTGK